MDKDILALIEERSSAFSRGQRTIGSYIMSSYEQAAFMTAGRIAKVAGVSESTVVRFAMELGYDGYPSMQKDLRELVLRRLSEPNSAPVCNTGGDDASSTVFDADIARIRKTQDGLDRCVLQSSVETLLDAENIFVFGMGFSSSLANYLADCLMMMFDGVRRIGTHGPRELSREILDIRRNDAIMALSLQPHDRYENLILELLRGTGATLIGIADTADCAVGGYADHLLIAACEPVGLAYALAAPMSLISVLVTALEARRGDVLKERQQRMDWIRQQIRLDKK